MNTLFWLIVAGLLILALSILLWPLLRTRPVQTVDAAQRNLGIVREQLAELQQQLQDGLLAQAQFDAQYQELQLGLQNELEAPEHHPVTAQGRWIAPLLLVFIPLFSISLYLHLTEPDVLQKAEEQQSRDQVVAKLRDVVGKIISRVEQNPDDVEGWRMLGRSYFMLQDYAKAAQVFARLYQLQPDNMEVIINYVNSLAMANNGQLAGKASTLIDRALQLDPDNRDILWLAGLAKAEEGNSAQAIAHWQKLAASLPEDSAALPQVKQMIAEQLAQSGAAAPVSALHIKVSVALDKVLTNQVAADQTVFIYAQALNGPKMPLAITRKHVADLPLTVELDDSMAMQPAMRLSHFKELKIIARVSKTGNASSQTGDFLGSQALIVSEDNPAVSVTINQEVK